MVKTALSLLLLATLFISPVCALPLPVVEVPYAVQAPALNCDLRDPSWATAARIAGLGQPMVPGKPAAQEAAPRDATALSLLWNQQHLYVRFVVADAEIYTPFSGRDALHYQGDVAEIFLDAVGDGRHYYELQFGPRGGVLDQYIAITAEPRTDEYGCLLSDVRQKDFWPNLAWDCPGLESKAKILAEPDGTTRWIVDVAVPAAAILQRLGKQSFEPGTLRANFLRYDWPMQADGKRALQATNWSPVLHGSPHKSAARMGFLKLQPQVPVNTIP